MEFLDWENYVRPADLAVAAHKARSAASFIAQKERIGRLCRAVRPRSVVCMGAGYLNDIPLEDLIAINADVYFAEWIDRWLTGSTVPGPGAVVGHRFEATCATAVEAAKLAECCGTQWDEQRWLAARLREAAAAWEPLVGPTVVVVLREVLGGSTMDEEVVASLVGVPAWLSGDLDSSAAARPDATA